MSETGAETASDGDLDGESALGGPGGQSQRGECVWVCLCSSGRWEKEAMATELSTTRHCTDHHSVTDVPDVSACFCVYVWTVISGRTAV